MVVSLVPRTTPAEVHVVKDPEYGLDGLIVLHSTALGPAAGGCRLWSYRSGDEMTEDALRLAEGMTYKNAIAGLPFGGGKAVLTIPSGPFDRDKMFEAFGRAVRRLEGNYVTAEDVGTTVEDMRAVARSTRHVAGLPGRDGAPGGDPSPFTARGTFLAMQTAAQRRLHRPLSDCTVAIQGMGNVGSALALLLHRAGARLVVADVDSARVARVAVMTGALIVPSRNILSVAADIVAPCALGGVLTGDTIGHLRAKVVCGAANNQLGTAEDGSRLADAGVLYAPDYVVNSGGIINVAGEYLGWSQEEVEARIDGISERLDHVLNLAAARGISNNLAADQAARSIIASSAIDQAAA